MLKVTAALNLWVESDNAKLVPAEAKKILEGLDAFFKAHGMAWETKMSWQDLPPEGAPGPGPFHGEYDHTWRK